jgi:hypothetical protein
MVASTISAPFLPRIGSFRDRVSYQLDAGHQAALSHVADVRQSGDSGQMFAKTSDFRLNCL